MFDRKVFFDTIRGSVFGGSMSQPQVSGTEAILAAVERHRVSSLQYVANILAEVHHETGGYMTGVKETVYASHKDKNPSDAEVIRRLDAAFAKGQLSWVKTPYWRDGWFGRGPIQLTHRENYLKFEKRLGVPLTKYPERALDLTVGADIAVVGMVEGMFTGKRLSNYTFPGALMSAPASNPRRIINGKDGTDAKVAGVHLKFAKALAASGWTLGSSPAPVPGDKIVLPEPTELPDVPDTPLDVGGQPAASPDVAPQRTGGGGAVATAGWVQLIVNFLIALAKRSAK